MILTLSDVSTHGSKWRYLIRECCWLIVATEEWKMRQTTSSTTHQHLYLPKDYSGSPTTSIYAPWTEAEVLAHLATGWGEGAISNLKLEYLYGPEPEVSGE